MNKRKFVSVMLSLLAMTASHSALGENGGQAHTVANASAVDVYGGPMGFTPWPHDLSQIAQVETYQFIQSNATLISHHLDGGVPWSEALHSKPYSADLMADWKERTDHTPSNLKVLLSLTPLSFARDGLAPYWGYRDNMPLPAEWQNRRLNSWHVRRAYTNYVVKAVEYFEPDYLAIGIESNVLISRKPEIWNDYLALHSAVYAAIKARKPNLPVFATVQYEHLRGKEAESKPNQILQLPGVASLMKTSDLLALSTYRFGLMHNDYNDSFFDTAKSFGKKIAIAEMGAMSKPTQMSWTLLPATEDDQLNHMQMVLQTARTQNFEFVVNWVAIDFDRLVEKLPQDLAEVSRSWVHTGLIDSDGRSKKALALWRRHLNK